MFLLPLDHFEIYTHINPTEAYQKLFSVVGTQKGWEIFSERSDKPYLGTVGNGKFKISRKIWYRNSSLPVILGEIHPNGKGSRINITMRLDWGATGFLAFWLGMVILMFINFSSNWLVSILQKTVEGNPPFEIMVPVGFFIFGYFLVMLIPYKIEAGIARSFLFHLFGKEKVVIHERFLGISDIQIPFIFFLLLVIFILLAVLYKLLVGLPS